MVVQRSDERGNTFLARRLWRVSQGPARVGPTVPDTENQDRYVADPILDEMLSHHIGAEARAKFGALAIKFRVLLDRGECLSERLFIHRPLPLIPVQSRYRLRHRGDHSWLVVRGSAGVYGQTSGCGFRPSLTNCRASRRISARNSGVHST